LRSGIFRSENSRPSIFAGVKKVKHALGVLWAWYYFFIFTVLFIVLYPLFALFLSREKWYPLANRLRVWWAKILFPLTGIIPRIHYHQPLDRKRNYIFCSNHFSYLDIPVSALVVKRNWRFMAKVELGDIPLLNIFFDTVDITVDRESRGESFRAFQEAAESLEAGMSIVNYPEGMIASQAPRMVRFKNGAFRLAIEKQIPIVPLTMLDNWRLLYVNGWTMYGRPGQARVIVHAPVETAALTLEDVNKLKQQVYETIDADLRKHFLNQP
jgi:1-acyl-sn-glycerol-3-phosphate acyltransferase